MRVHRCLQLLGQNENGLDLIESLQLGSRAILVSSRFEEKAIVDRVKWLDVKMIPKGLAHIVPILSSFSANVDTCEVSSASKRIT